MKHNKETQDCSREITLGAEVPDDEPVTRNDIPLTGESRRRFIKGAFAAAPVIMTVTSRPVWGGNACTPSGKVSGNLSSPGADEVECNTGLTPNGYIYLEVSIDTVTSLDTDTSLTTDTTVTTYEWALRDEYAPSNTVVKSLFSDVFGDDPMTAVNGNHTLRNVLLAVAEPEETTTTEATATETTATETTATEAIATETSTTEATATETSTLGPDTSLETFTDWKYNNFDRTAVAAYFNAVMGYTPYLTPYMVECMVRDVLNGGMYEVTAGVYWGQQEVYDYFWSTFDTTTSN